MENFYHLNINMLSNGNTPRTNTPYMPQKIVNESDEFVKDQFENLFIDSTWLEARGVRKLQFDVKVKWNKIDIDKIYLIETDGSKTYFLDNLSSRRHFRTYSKLFSMYHELYSATPKTKGVVAMNNSVASNFLVTKIAIIVMTILAVLFGVTAAFESVPKEVSVIGFILTSISAVAIYAFDRLFRRYFE